MTAIQLPSDEMVQLISALIDDDLSEPDHAKLARMLAGDAALRASYCGQLRMHAQLAWNSHRAPVVGLSDLGIISEAGAQPFVRPLRVQSHAHDSGEAPTSPSPPALSFLSNTFHGTIGYFSQDLPLSLLVASAVVGFGLWIGSLIIVPRDVEMTRESVPPVAEPSRFEKIEHVGRITGMVDCRWEKKGLGIGDWGLEKGSGFRAQSTQSVNHKSEIINQKFLVSLGDKFALASGLIEITYDSGAKVVLQGPVTYEVESKAGGYLSLGKLTARVEKNEEVRTKNEEVTNSGSSLLVPHSYFAVRTPTATVTDLGTEFGVEVSREGQTTSHVFLGSVAFQIVSKDGKPVGAMSILHENESAQVEKKSGGEGLTVRRSSVDPAAFVRSEQLQKLAEEPRLKPFRRWQAYSQELRRDPSLLAYYDFQQKKGFPALLPNVASNGDKSLDGVIENAEWTNGRMRGKHALRFGGQDDYVRINLPKTVDNLTMAAWINVQSLDNPFNGLLMSDDWDQAGLMHWQLLRDGRISFGISGSKTPYCPYLSYLSAPVFDPVRSNRWSHLAVVYDHAAAYTKFYLDGQTFVEERVQGHVPIRIGSARIGYWGFTWSNSAPGPDLTVRNFRGWIDELAIFGRPLPASEIQRIFEAGKPPDVNNIAEHSNER